MSGHTSGVLFSLLAAIGIVASLVMSLVLMYRAWVSGRRIVVGGWIIVLGCLVGMLLLDTGWVRPEMLDANIVVLAGWPISWLEVVAMLVALGIGTFLLWQVWKRPVARWCVLIALLIGLTNPLTEAAEGRLVSDGVNYEFIANNQPYRFRDSASLRLDRIQTAQELTESLSIVMLALGLSLIVVRRQPDRLLGDRTALADPALPAGS